MPGGCVRRRSDDRYLHGLRVVTVSLAGLGLITAVVLPVTGGLSGSAHTKARATTQAAVVAAPPVVAAEAPMDLARSDEWWLGIMHAQKAWKSGHGQGVTVAVLDTGVDGRHADLSGQVVQGPDYTAGGRMPGSRYWGRHGTSIAGIIAGHGHGTGGTAGVLGIAPLAKILSIRVTWENNDPIRQSRGAALQDRDAVAKGIRYAVDHGANVINMSLGGTNATFNGTVADEDAIKYALDRGVVLVASMGNDGAPPTKKYFPAAYPGVIAVGAVDRKLKPWKDSNQGDYVSVAAPGVGIVSTDTGNAYQVTDGTSASSAIVSGVVALVRSRFPHMTPDQIRQVLQQGVTHQPVSGRDDQVGSGVVDAGQVMDAAIAADQAANGTVTATPAAVAPKVTTASDGSVNLLLIGILGGGGALVTTGLVLGWLQRRRPEDDSEEQPNSPSGDDETEGEQRPLEKVRMAAAALKETAKERVGLTQPIAQTAPTAKLGALRPFDPETDAEPARVNGENNGAGAGHSARGGDALGDGSVSVAGGGMEYDNANGNGASHGSVGGDEAGATGRDGLGYGVPDDSSIGAGRSLRDGGTDGENARASSWAAGRDGIGYGVRDDGSGGAGRSLRDGSTDGENAHGTSSGAADDDEVGFWRVVEDGNESGADRGVRDGTVDGGSDGGGAGSGVVDGDGVGAWDGDVGGELVVSEEPEYLQGFGPDPLGDIEPLAEEEAAEISTPLADESWLRVRGRAIERLPEVAEGSGLGDDGLETDPFPEVGPVTDLPLQDLPEAPIRRPTLRKERFEDDDYRPPWL